MGPIIYIIWADQQTEKIMSGMANYAKYKDAEIYRLKMELVKSQHQNACYQREAQASRAKLINLQNGITPLITKANKVLEGCVHYSHAQRAEQIWNDTFAEPQCPSCQRSVGSQQGTHQNGFHGSTMYGEVQQPQRSNEPMKPWPDFHLKGWYSNEAQPERYQGGNREFSSPWQYPENNRFAPKAQPQRYQGGNQEFPSPWNYPENNRFAPRQPPPENKGFAKMLNWG